ncbi:phosphate regulon sensor histidine kinase PhoR [Spongiibacter tropicus]|uniref:phosphate regulon sensor histidine kinase PhoR n=1 Tax=Spongiibacter tropicus TaxID=454602 RepID=UPI003A99B831
MRYYDWKTELVRVMLPLAAAAVLSTAFELGAWPVFVVAAGICTWLLWQLQRLSDWLYRGSGTEPPEAIGMWGQIFDTIYDMQKQATGDHDRLQAMIDYLRASFASMSDAVVMLDHQGNIEWCNDAASELLGLRREDDTGLQLLNLIRAPSFVGYYEAEKYGAPLEMASPVNADIQLSISISFFAERNRLLFARDITRTYRLEKMRKDFVANVSHELRTPLTVINGYLETFAEHGGENPRWDRAIEQMLKQSRRMHHLIQDLMLLSRLESVPKPKEQDRIVLRPLLEMVREEALAAAKGDRSIEIECDDSIVLKGQATEIRSALSNLAVNAARYTAEGDRIVLRWYQTDSHAVLEVQDSGIGIEPQYIPRLTERFYRVDQSRSLDTGGTGLGLAIVKHVLLRHRGELRVRSHPGNGSTFSCLFPKSLATKAESAA